MTKNNRRKICIQRFARIFCDLPSEWPSQPRHKESCCKLFSKTHIVPWCAMQFPLNNCIIDCLLCKVKIVCDSCNILSRCLILCQLPWIGGAILSSAARIATGSAIDWLKNLLHCLSMIWKAEVNFHWMECCFPIRPFFRLSASLSDSNAVKVFVHWWKTSKLRHPFQLAIDNIATTVHWDAPHTLVGTHFNSCNALSGMNWFVMLQFIALMVSPFVAMSWQRKRLFGNPHWISLNFTAETSLVKPDFSMVIWNNKWAIKLTQNLQCSLFHPSSSLSFSPCCVPWFDLFCQKRNPDDLWRLCTNNETGNQDPYYVWIIAEEFSLHCEAQFVQVHWQSAALHSSKPLQMAETFLSLATMQVSENEMFKVFGKSFLLIFFMQMFACNWFACNQWKTCKPQTQNWSKTKWTPAPWVMNH